MRNPRVTNVPPILDTDLYRNGSMGVILQAAIKDDNNVFQRWMDLTGLSAKLELRAERDPTSPVLFTLSTDDGTILLGEHGEISVLWNSVDTNFVFDYAVQDLMLYDKLNPNNTIYLYTGRVNVYQSVTQ